MKPTAISTRVSTIPIGANDSIDLHVHEVHQDLGQFLLQRRFLLVEAHLLPPFMTFSVAWTQI